MKKTIIFKTIIFIIIITVINFKAPPVFAADSTPSADIKLKLKALQEEIASKAAKIKQDIGRKLQNKAFSGFIKVKSENSLTLATKSGTKIVTVNEYTQYEGQGTVGKQTKVNLKNLALEDYIIALGDVDDNEVLTAKKVIKTVSTPQEKQMVFGQVVSTDNQVITIQNKEEQNLSVSTDDDTVYRLGKDTGSLKNIKMNKPIIAVGESSKNGVLKARFVYVFPYSSVLDVKAASTSAQPKQASPQATPKKQRSP